VSDKQLQQLNDSTTRGSWTDFWYPAVKTENAQPEPGDFSFITYPSEARQTGIGFSMSA
jgi:hypothetical protein